MANEIIVSFASKGREDYPSAQLRMLDSCLSAGWSGDYLIRRLDGNLHSYKEIPILTGSYTHTHAEIPYGFKPDIIMEAANKGYTQIAWMDSTILMNRDISLLFNYAEKYGVTAFHNSAHPLKYWISDIAAENIGITDLDDVKQIMACSIIFDLSNPTGLSVFNDWYKLSKDGVSFQDSGSKRDDFVAHRHDQAVLSGLLHLYNIPLRPYGDLVYHPDEEKYPGTFLINKGI